jgi:hypothetical protein
MGFASAMAMLEEVRRSWIVMEYSAGSDALREHERRDLRQPCWLSYMVSLEDFGCLCWRGGRQKVYGASPAQPSTKRSRAVPFMTLH